MSANDEIALTEALEPLRQSFERDADVIAVWEAIGRVSSHNKRSAEKGLPPRPLPDWVCVYLAHCSDKVERLWLGIDPDDNRSFQDITFDEVGKLRKVPQSDGGGTIRFRDERASHIGQALGFVHNGWTAFQCHDRTTRDAQLLKIYDDPSLEEHPGYRREVQQLLIGLVGKQENVTEASVRNRLSKARKTRRSS